MYLFSFFFMENCPVSIIVGLDFLPVNADALSYVQSEYSTFLETTAFCVKPEIYSMQLVLYAILLKKVKVGHIRLPSVGFRS